jgi:NAD(P)-dependent dehydrogenase (short-subunit alcohol dehydrogenase family)
MELGAGTVAVVTGAGSGIGLALSHAFAKAGCSVVLADVQVDALEHAATEVAEHGVDTLAVRTDVSSKESIDELVQSTLDRFGAVHVVCNNAGVSGAGDPWLGPIEGWEWTMGVNFWGVVYGIRAFLPHLIASGGGHVVNTASMAGLYPGFAPPYDASKHAVVAISESLYNSMQAGMMPIGVSCLCPGWVRTGILDADRNWPSELGELPATNAASEVTRNYVRRAIDEGTPPAVIADMVVESVREDRYWVIPHDDFLEIAMERFHSIGERRNPQPPEETPGMPPRQQMMAEVMEAMMAETTEMAEGDG